MSPKSKRQVRGQQPWPLPPRRATSSYCLPIPILLLKSVRPYDSKHFAYLLKIQRLSASSASKGENLRKKIANFKQMLKRLRPRKMLFKSVKLSWKPILSARLTSMKLN